MTEKEKMYCETVKIVPDFTRDDMVSPLLFGNNLEHTRSCVNKGISAQMLRNRKFVGKPACYDGTPEEWFLIGNHVNILFNESSRNSANIRNPLIYYVNRYFLMFGGSQVQKPYHASMNGFLTF